MLSGDALSEFQKKSCCILDYEESRFASTRGDVDDWRAGETNHRATNDATKQKRVRINKHRLQHPARVAEDGEGLCVQIDCILCDVVSRKRSRDSIVPRALIHFRAEINAVATVIVVRFENETRAIFTDELKEIDPSALARRFPIGDASSPWYGMMDCFVFAGGKPVLMFLVGEQLKHRFLVHDFALNIARLNIGGSFDLSTTTIGTARGLIGMEVQTALNRLADALGGSINLSDADNLDILRRHMFLGQDWT